MRNECIVSGIISTTVVILVVNVSIPIICISINDIANIFSPRLFKPNIILCERDIAAGETNVLKFY